MSKCCSQKYFTVVVRDVKLRYSGMSKLSKCCSQGCLSVVVRDVFLLKSGVISYVLGILGPRNSASTHEMV